jgi:hypothetical protein
MMLESLILRNFTAFSEADFEFAPGLNVIVGENGTGKTHILKVAYSCVYVFNEEARKAGPSMPIIPYLKAAVCLITDNTYQNGICTRTRWYGKMSYDTETLARDRRSAPGRAGGDVPAGRIRCRHHGGPHNVRSSPRGCGCC